MMRRRLLRIGLIALAVLLVLVLVVPFLVPVPPLTAAKSPTELARPNSRFIDVPLDGDTLTVHTEITGQPDQPALLLLHGFAASTFSWREVMDTLGKQWNTVAFDRPAFGLTERPLPETWQGDWSTQNPYTLDAQVDLAVGVLDQQGIDQAVLVGNSAGGTVAMRTALAHPERVKALVLISPAVYENGGSQSPVLRWLLGTPQAQRLGPLLARQIQDRGLSFARSAWHDPARLTDTTWAGYQAPLQVADWDRALWESTAARTPNGLAKRLSELTMPVLVITGDDDRIVATDQSIRLAGELPNAKLVVIPDCGHVPQEECPQAVLTAMEEFLAEVTAMPPAAR